MKHDVGTFVRVGTARFRDLTGLQIGRLFVLTRTSQISKGVVHWLCKCNCGKLAIRCTSKLVDVATPSCGCYMHDFGVENGTKHGMSRTLTYGSWSNAKSRCYRKRDKNFPSYGGRGIKVCDRWKDSFENFYADMGECPEGMTLDRIDNNGDYAPDNCRWATPKEQVRNRRNTTFVTFGGKTVPLPEVSDFFFLPYSSIRTALNTKGEVGLPLYIESKYDGDFSARMREWLL